MTVLTILDKKVRKNISNFLLNSKGEEWDYVV